ncbi:FAD linked oxidase domain-containing protein [Candidatus Nitrosopumilus koreensis AR1]|uniref:D-lactate dehydrogenase (cytochrome) n=1 Tax=Candidatus Nitrosopumilus koreensis AR1 TaxID=1229908 RepID=K0B667_9ARCH|nr:MULTISPECIES: FAD-binding oxidoreductase [Nitrosopumilus]AFS80647.1 FAD linked oxidase domain-containing protein [Candidatus Nitrosopumilus koreensis AR1]
MSSLSTELSKVVQGEIHTEKEFKKFYSVDASSYQIIPKVIIIPKNEKDIINTIKIAKKFKTTVTVRGAGTGLVGSALNNGIVLDMKNFDSIKVEENQAVVGPGAVKGKLDRILEKNKKFFPPNPSIGSFCSIGGMIGNNSSGSRSLKYGSVIDNVIEITIIDGNGNKVVLPKNQKFSNKIKNKIKIDKEKFPEVSKNSSGYRIDKIKTAKDSHKIIIGSEGTLGIITAAKLKIKNIPKKRILFVIEYDSISNVASDCIKINNTNPSAIEFVDRTTLQQIDHNFQKNTKCLLFVEYDEKIIQNERKIKQTISGSMAKKLTKKQEIHKWWKYRDSSLYYSLRSIKKENRIPHVIEDAAVPIEKLPELFSTIENINKKFKTKSIIYGHIGNGNLHIRLIAKRIETSSIKDIAVEFFDKIIKMGGTITAEHGDGLARSEFIKKQYGKTNYETFKDIKKLFDPKNVLNPGKIIVNKSTIIKNLERL